MKNPLSPARIQNRLRQVGQTLGRLRSPDLSPGRAARSVATGLFVGSTPFYGFHFFICAGLSYLLRLDLLLTYIAANISIAPLVPVIVFTQIQVGAFVLEGHFLSLTLSGFNLEEALKMTQRLFVGALLVGGSLALVGGALAFWIAKFFRKSELSDADRAFFDATTHVKALYARAPAAHRHYVSSKLRFDPLTHELFLLAHSGRHFGRVTDAGCGRGQFSLLLLKLKAAESVFGFDHDEAKVRTARIASESLSRDDARFETGDLRNKAIAPSDTILLLDVLHYLSAEQQLNVLETMASKLETGGIMLVRETNHQGSFGAQLASLFERLGRFLGINRGERLVFLSPKQLEEALSRLGFRVVRHTPKGALDNVLLVAEKLTNSR